MPVMPSSASSSSSPFISLQHATEVNTLGIHTDAGHIWPIFLAYDTSQTSGQSYFSIKIFSTVQRLLCRPTYTLLGRFKLKTLQRKFQLVRCTKGKKITSLMFAKKKNYTHKNRPVLGLKHREDDDASVTTKHRGVDVGSVYRNNTRHYCK